MKRFMNDPQQFVDDSLSGILHAYPQYLRDLPQDHRAILRAGDIPSGQVPIITGGGYGHIPLFLGFVGEGLCSGCAVGNIFTTPSFDTILKLTQSVPQERGILYLLGNYTGDRINFEMAAQYVAMEGIRCEQVIITDDVASASRANHSQRRSIAGIALAYKLAGACSQRGDRLEEITALLTQVNENMGSLGVALSSCQIPGMKSNIFSLGEGEIEFGIGIHGEQGTQRIPVAPSNKIAGYLVTAITQDLCLNPCERVIAMVNGMGGTTQEELFILYNDIQRYLEEKRLQVVFSYVGNYTTSLGMRGASLTLLRYEDAYGELLTTKAVTPFVNYFYQPKGFDTSESR